MKSDAIRRPDFGVIAHELLRRENLALAARVKRLEETLHLAPATRESMTDFRLKELRDRVAARMTNEADKKPSAGSFAVGVRPEGNEGGAEAPRTALPGE
jgi:hypothetical protein